MRGLKITIPFFHRNCWEASIFLQGTIWQKSFWKKAKERLEYSADFSILSSFLNGNQRFHIWRTFCCCNVGDRADFGKRVKFTPMC